MYMLDIDTCSYVLKTRSAKLAKRFMVDVGKIAISEIVLAELRFGAENHQNRTEQIHDLIDDFIVRLHIGCCSRAQSRFNSGDQQYQAFQKSAWTKNR